MPAEIYADFEMGKLHEIFPFQGSNLGSNLGWGSNLVVENADHVRW